RGDRRDGVRGNIELERLEPALELPSRVLAEVDEVHRSGEEGARTLPFAAAPAGMIIEVLDLVEDREGAL
ncbi:hypothetical protein AAULH_13991, partial [Lactobacillus helveticus MTCC 5463]